MSLKSSATTPILSVIITGHAEGILIHRTLHSVRRALAELPKSYSHEIILHLDNPTPESRSYVERQTEANLNGVRVFENTFGDLGASRNFAIQEARGKYIATIDADDLMSKNWLRHAVNYLEDCKRPTIAHSQYTVEFEGADSLVIKHGQIDYETDTLLSVYANRWNSVIVAPRELMLANPYAPNSPGYGYEDWNFNCRIIYQHIDNVLIPETAIFVRRKRTNSEWARQVSSMSVLRANPLLSFENIREIQDPFALEFKKHVANASASFDARLRRLIKRNKYSHGLARRVKIALKRERLSVPKNQHRVPSWLQAEWRDLHEIDRQIFPTPHLMETIPVYDTLTYEHRLSGHVYKQLIDQLRYSSYSYVIFVPWLVKGGADKYAINYANTIANLTNTNVLVVATLDTRSVWQAQLADKVDFMDFGRLTAGVSQEIKHRLMEHIIENSRTKVLHVINSEFGYEFVRLHENYIRSSEKKVVATSFSQSVDPTTGKLYGYSHTHVPFVYDIATLVTSDNRAVIDMWEKEYGFDPEKMLVHRQPLSISDDTVKKDFSLHSPLRVLWAGRIAPEKMPELVPVIAEQLGDKVHIDMYGSIEAGNESVLSNLPSNVTYRGSYDGFESLDSNSYDILLYTSLFDGMPNIILEAASTGLPLVASAVGGIPEFIENEQTGLLIEDIHNPDAYISAIEHVIAERGITKTLADGAMNRVKEAYSPEKYSTEVAKMLHILGL